MFDIDLISSSGTIYPPTVIKSLGKLSNELGKPVPCTVKRVPPAVDPYAGLTDVMVEGMSSATTPVLNLVYPIPAIMTSGRCSPATLGSGRSHVTEFEVLTRLMHVTLAYCT